MRRVILGVDPGLRTTGYGAIVVGRDGLRLVEGGIVTPDPGLPLEQRLVQLHAAMVEVVCAIRPACMVVEELWTAYSRRRSSWATRGG
jgi:crossover junction endodeoxyribonuclease RuvC